MKEHGMMKTILTLMLALSVCMVPACGTAEETAQDNAVIRYPNTGVQIEILPAFNEAEGVIVPVYDFEFQDTGVSVAGLVYYAISSVDFTLLAGKSQLTDKDAEYLKQRAADLLWVFCIDKNRGADELAAILTNIVGINADGLEETGTAGEYRFFRKAGPDAEIAGSFEAAFREEYESLVKTMEETPGWIQVMEPEKPGSAISGSVISFETADLAGNPVKSEELFSPYELTMINLWGTFCGPCIQEMPGLETLYQTMKPRKVNVIGVVVDISGPDDIALIEDAESIIDMTGVKYMNLLPWDSIDDMLPADYIPTTYFVDAQGRVVGEAAVGARGPESYEALIDQVLAIAGK